jgi:hypothetical protein
MASIRGQVNGETLNARSDIRLRHLDVERAGPNDQAQAHIGLPLGVLVSLMKNRQGDIAVSFPVSGRLNDPRFHFSEAIWKAARTVTINAIATPVSWIGRLQYTADSRIEKVQIDPIHFRPGTAALTPEGEAQTMRLAGFLEQVPEARLTLTPVVTSGDLARLARQPVEATIARMARDAKISPEEAAARLFAQRFPERQRPETLEKLITALAEREPPPSGDVSDLAAKRREAVSGKLKQAKVDTARLVENKVAARGQATEGQVRVDLVEYDGAKAPPGSSNACAGSGAGSSVSGERPSCPPGHDPGHPRSARHRRRVPDGRRSLYRFAHRGRDQGAPGRPARCEPDPPGRGVERRHRLSERRRLLGGTEGAGGERGQDGERCEKDRQRPRRPARARVVRCRAARHRGDAASISRPARRGA